MVYLIKYHGKWKKLLVFYDMSVVMMKGGKTDFSGHALDVVTLLLYIIKQISNKITAL